MDRERLILIVGLTLFGVFVLGWIAGWIVARLGRASTADLAALDDLAAQLTQAEAARDTARAQGHTAEAEAGRLRDALDLAQTRIEDLRSYIERNPGR